MSFWSLPYSSSAQQEIFEKIEKEKQLKMVWSIVENFVKTFVARARNLENIWDFEKFEHNFVLAPPNDAEIVSSFTLDKESMENTLKITHADEFQNRILKAIVETFFDDRYFFTLQNHVSSINTYFSSKILFKFIINDHKENSFCLIFRENEVKKQQQLQLTTVNNKSKLKSGVSRFFKKK